MMGRASAFLPVCSRFSAGQYEIALWQQPGASTLVYLHPGSNDAIAAVNEVFLRAAASRTPFSPFAIACIDGVDWNRDLSPFPAPQVFRSGGDFSGGADAYLDTLLTNILPAVEATFDAPVQTRALAGYSMGGLFALYAMYRTDRFSRFASMSGSLWFDGFLPYMETHAPIGMPEHVYLSLGSAEKRTNNARLAAVEECTLQACALLSTRGIPTVFVPQPGGHSADVPKRLADGVLAMLR